MDKRFIGAGLGLLALAAILALGPFGSSVALKTGALNPNEPPGMRSCYTSGTSGDLVTDPDAGTAIIDQQTGRRMIVTWPIGWTGRSSMGGVEVVDTQGNVNARTGSYVQLRGGHWLDGTFLTCGTVH